MSIGQLVVELIASTATFQSDLGKAATEAERQAKRIDAALDSALAGLKSKLLGIAGALGVSLSAASFVNIIKGAIDAEEELGRVAARAGLTGEQLSTLTTAALRSRTPLEDVAIMSARLSKALIESQDASTKQAAVLRALGINSSDTARLLANPLEAIQRISKALAPLGESGTGAAAQIILLGRAGGTTAAFLGELAKQQGLVATRTNEEIAAAKEFTDKLVDMEIRSANLKTALGNALLPTLGDTVDALAKLSTEGGGVKGTIDSLAADHSLQEWARDAAITVATVAESLVFMGRSANAVIGSFRVAAADIDVILAKANAPRTKPFGALGFTPEEAAANNAALDAALARRNRILEDADKNYRDLVDKNAAFLSDALKRQFDVGDLTRRAQAGEFDDPRDIQNKNALEKKAAQAARDAAALAKRVQDAVRDVVATRTGGEDPSKKILDRQIAEIEASLEEEKHVLSAREEFLSAYYAHNDVTLDEYFKTRQSSIAEGLAFQEKAFDEEVAATREFIDSRQQLLTKGDTRAPGYASAAKDIEEGEKRIIDITKRRTTAEQEAAQKSIKNWFDQRQAVEDYAKAVFDATSQELDNKLARINLLVQAGSVTELGALSKSRDAINGKIGALNEELAAYEKVLDLANRGGDAAAIAKAQNDIEGLRLKLEALAVQADAVNKQFRDVFVNDFANALVDAATGTKSLKDAFKDMAHSIVRDLDQIAAKELATQLFGKGGFFGGGGSGFDLGGIFAKLFGFGGGGGSDAPQVAAQTANTAALAELTIALAANTAAVGASGAASGLNAFGGLGGSDSFGLGSLGLFQGAFADGTDFVPRTGLALIHKGEKITPARFNTPNAANDAQTKVGGHTFHININVPGNTSTATAAQIARETGIAVRRELHAAGMGR